MSIVLGVRRQRASCVLKFKSSGSHLNPAGLLDFFHLQKVDMSHIIVSYIEGLKVMIY